MGLLIVFVKFVNAYHLKISLIPLVELNLFGSLSNSTIFKVIAIPI